MTMRRKAATAGSVQRGADASALDPDHTGRGRAPDGPQRVPARPDRRALAARRDLHAFRVRLSVRGALRGLRVRQGGCAGSRHSVLRLGDARRRRPDPRHRSPDAAVPAAQLLDRDRVLEVRNPPGGARRHFRARRRRVAARGARDRRRDQRPRAALARSRRGGLARRRRGPARAGCAARLGYRRRIRGRGGLLPRRVALAPC
jgi:hypothetical protein